jgi:uncharacterized protein involved in exopolysaccharide biosynthesis
LLSIIPVASDIPFGDPAGLAKGVVDVGNHLDNNLLLASPLSRLRPSYNRDLPSSPGSLHHRLKKHLKEEVQESEEVELIDCLRVIWKRRRLIVLGTLLCMAISFVVSFFLPKTYEASAIIEIGATDTKDDKLEDIEDPNMISEVLTSDQMISKLKNRLHSELSLKALKKRVKVRGDKQKAPASRFLELSLRLDNPQQVVDGVNFLATQIIEEHDKVYQKVLNRLDGEINSIIEKIKNNGVQKEKISLKIDNIHSQIKTDNGYTEVIKAEIEKELKSIQETIKQLSELKPSQMNPLEIIFLQESLKNQEMQLTGLYREMNDILIRNKDREKQIHDLETQSSVLDSQNEDLRANGARLQQYKDMSENTKIRSAPVVPDQSIGPTVLLNTVIGGISGLILLPLLSFFLEYLEQARKAKKPGSGHELSV